MPDQRVQHRRGMTLVELLVVIAILLILVTAATAMMSVATDGRDLREAARQLNAMIAGCVARAAETGRPYGVWIERTPGNLNAGREVFYAQAPPVYAGDALNSVCQVTPGTGDVIFHISGTPGGVIGLRGADNTVNTADDFVRAGDTIRFNYSGPWYPVSNVIDQTSLKITIGDRPLPQAAYAVPFQIRRGPRKSLASPLQMPGDTIIDLSQSGFNFDSTIPGSGTEFAGGTDAVRIMFTPSGSLDGVYFNGSARPEAIHLLVGRLVPVAPITSNLQDPAARWVSINHQTGTVITTENIPGGATLDVNRKFAREGKGMQGN